MDQYTLKGHHEHSPKINLPNKKQEAVGENYTQIA